MISTSNIYINTDDQVLLCPWCKEDYMHIVKVNYITRRQEDGQATRTTVDSIGDITTSVEKKAPGRRDTLVIRFWCESCNNHPELTLQQHKGNTFVEWN